MNVSTLRTESLVIKSNQAWQALGARRFGKFAPYLGVAAIRSRHPGSRATGLNAVLDARIDNIITLAETKQTTWTAGVRFDFRQNFALKFQIDRVDGDDNPNLLWANETPAWDGNATVLSVGLDFIY